MKQKTLSNWLKLIVIVLAICGLVICFVILPVIGRDIALAENGEFDYAFWPWLIFLWLFALPCFAACVIGWKIAVNIGRDRSFCDENAKLISLIAILAAADSAFFFVGNIVMLFLNMSHPGIVLASWLCVLIGAAISIGMACLSHLVRKAAALQEESDLTV